MPCLYILPTRTKRVLSALGEAESDEEIDDVIEVVEKAGFVKENLGHRDFYGRDSLTSVATPGQK